MVSLSMPPKQAFNYDYRYLKTVRLRVEITLQSSHFINLNDITYLEHKQGWH